VRLHSQDEGGRFFWVPLGFDENTKEKYIMIWEKQGIQPNPLSKELILASAVAWNAHPLPEPAQGFQEIA
jgi:hypothetical protein